MSSPKEFFVFGVDLDGVCADFCRRMKEVAAEWKGVSLGDLTENVAYGLKEWEIHPDYQTLHRFAVTERGLFETMAVIPGARQSLWRLSEEGVRIRIITRRLFIPYFHERAVAQTCRWLDQHGIPCWDLCFMAEKGAVGADVYIDDTPHNIEQLVTEQKDVIIFTNSTNRNMQGSAQRADTWEHAEGIVREKYYRWLEERGMELPSAPGVRPSWRDGGMP